MSSSSMTSSANGGSNPNDRTVLKLSTNSKKEVRLLCLLHIEHHCANESKSILPKPRQAQYEQWSKYMNIMTTQVSQMARDLVAVGHLSRLSVVRVSSNHEPNAANNGTKRSRWSASYKMVEEVLASCLTEARNFLVKQPWRMFTKWIQKEIEILQYDLYDKDHEYVLDFSKHPKMLDWLDWKDEDTTTDESDPYIHNGCMFIQVGDGKPMCIYGDDENSCDGDSLEETDDSEESEQEGNAAGSSSRRSNANIISPKGAPDLLKLLLGISQEAFSAKNDLLKNAKTPECKKFMEALATRHRHGKKSTILESFDSLNIAEQKRLVDELKAVNEEKASKPLLLRILQSEIPKSTKNEIMTRFENSQGEVGEKYTSWVNQLLNMPFNQFVTPHNVTVAANGDREKIRTFLQESRDKLDSVVYGHDDAKDKLEQYIAQLVRQSLVQTSNTNVPSSKEPISNASRTSKGLVLGIQGPFGNGKTTLIEKGFSQVLGLPFAAIPLGGASDGSFLHGHGYTYEGSTCGQIANTLMKTKCNNPIIYMDELDKVSGSYKGEEVINQLVHLTDPSQNSHFQDRYFGNIDFDLSQVTWVFSYNDRSRIPPVLRDRITEVQTTGFTLPQKLTIANKFLVPSICEEIGMPQVSFSPNVVKYLVEQFTYEGGVRSIKKELFEICRKLNVDDLCGKVQLVANKRRRITRQPTVAGQEIASSSTSYAMNDQPFEVTMNVALNYMKNKTPMVKEKIHNAPAVGRINGLYASSGVDMGGIIPIETKLVPSDNVYGLLLTGNLGKVMQESGTVAKTLALQCTSKHNRAQWEERWKTVKESIHLHCPEGAVSKDGPSAGTALTVAMLSLLTGNRIKHDVGITGEINLFGEVLAIGGLRSKMYGAKSAGCKLVLYPKDNLKDYHKIVRECPDLFDDTFRAVAVGKLSDVLPYVFVGKNGLVKELETAMTTGNNSFSNECHSKSATPKKDTRRRSARLSGY